MINLIVQQFDGPTIIDLAPILHLIEGTVNVHWMNSHAEQILIEKHRGRDFLLHVDNLTIMEKSATALGLNYVLDSNVYQSGLAALIHQKIANWRAFTEGVGSSVSRSILTRLSADSIRKGGRPRLAAIAAESVLENMNPIDADVLLRIAALNAR
jgi:hypothetical protein